MAATFGVVATAAGLPWHRSGTVERTGFELARAVDRAGLVDGAWRRTLVVAVFLLPLLAGATLLAAALGRARAAGLAAVGAAVVTLAAAAVVVDVGGRQPGPWSGAAFGLAALSCGGYLILKGRT